MASDDDSGWTEILVDGWGPLVLAAVVARVERGLVGRRGVLVRALGEETASAAHAARVEDVHGRILEAVRDETGADLDDLGSQAAWSCYDQVWGRLQQHWHDGGRIEAVDDAHETEVAGLLASLSPAAAEHAGVDVGVVPWTPLRVAGRVRVDLEGLFAYLARDTGQVSDGERSLVDRVVVVVRCARS